MLLSRPTNSLKKYNKSLRLILYRNYFGSVAKYTCVSNISGSVIIIWTLKPVRTLDVVCDVVYELV